MRVIHKINPVWNSDSSVLILGSMPSAASRNAGFFYMHSQNRFWPVMAEVFGESFVHKNNSTDKNAAIMERMDFLLRHKIALWDVLAECEINGSEDSSIKQTTPNDFSEILENSQVEQIYCTGKTAFELYKKHCAKLYSVPFKYLPSTSPANQGRWSKEKLVEEYKCLLSVKYFPDL